MEFEEKAEMWKMETGTVQKLCFRFAGTSCVFHDSAQSNPRPYSASAAGATFCVLCGFKQHRGHFRIWLGNHDRAPAVWSVNSSCKHRDSSRCKCNGWTDFPITVSICLLTCVFPTQFEVLQLRKINAVRGRLTNACSSEKRLKAVARPSLFPRAASATIRSSFVAGCHERGKALYRNRR